MKWVRHIIAVVIIVLILAEIFLRVTGKYRVYSEIRGGEYVSEYGKTIKTWYPAFEPNDSLVPVNPDFSYLYLTNEFGLREKKISHNKSDSIFRILITGDSFTEGAGAPYDSTFPRMLEVFLKLKGFKVEVVNAGISGSDVLYSYFLYRDCLNVYNPDLVLGVINSSDYTDFIFRGGEERFLSYGSVQYTKAPWFEPLYKHSRLVRACFHVFLDFRINGLFLSSEKYKTESSLINSKFLAIITEYQKEVTKHNSKFAVVIHNIPSEIYQPQNVIFESNRINLNNLEIQLKQNNIRCINLQKALYDNFKNTDKYAYSYLLDFHYNSNGYKFLASLLSDSLTGDNVFIK